MTYKINHILLLGLLPDILTLQLTFFHLGAICFLLNQPAFLRGPRAQFHMRPAHLLIYFNSHVKARKGNKFIVIRKPTFNRDISVQ